MKILVDTTYVLPAIGIAIKGVSERLVLDLQRKDHSVSICTISLFELAAKGAKYVMEGKLKADTVLRGVKALASDETVRKVAYEDPGVLTWALDFRTTVVDFIDCLILSAAVVNCDSFATEDEELRELASQRRIREIMRQLNRDFSILSAKELL